MFHLLGIFLFLVVLLFARFVFNNAVKEYDELKKKEKNGETVNKDEKNLALLGSVLFVLSWAYCLAYVLSYFI